MPDRFNEAGISRNAAKAKLAAGGYAFGTMIQFIRTPAVARMAAAAGYDFVFIDTEHSSLNWDVVGDMCEMARAAGVAPIVRPYGKDASLAGRFLDIGALGLMFHDVTSRDQIDALLDATRYFPDGHRGVTTGSAPTDYRVGNGQALQKFINDQMMLVIQVESREGIEHIDEMLSGGSVDVVEIGRNDLSTDLGVPLELRHPKVLSAVDEIIAACKRHGVAPGMNVHSREDIEDLMARGIRCFSYGVDKNWLSMAFRSGMDLFHELMAREH
jgi:2-keto-3-deoxy-L-rhamnonate aldolase RhmA